MKQKDIFDNAEEELDGVAGFGVDAPSGRGSLADKFLLPPFSILNAREGWWQNRKRLWVEMGIQSELGRGANVLERSDMTSNISFYKLKRELEAELGKELSVDEAREELMRRGKIGNLLGLSDSLERYRQRAGEYGTDKLTPGGRGKNSVWTGKGQPPPDGYAKGDAETYGSGRPGDLSREFKRRNTASLKTGLVYGMTNDPYRKEGEEEVSASGCGTSIFDPVLCELAYRWFCPAGGQVVDPFAGGSVRGIVAAKVGVKYWGCDLARDQIVENERQARLLVYGTVPQYEIYDEKGLVKDGQKKGTDDRWFRVVRDDRVPGGTKERACRVWLESLGVTSVAYASPAQGFAQVALARVARDLGIKFHLFTAKRKDYHERTLAAVSYGAVLHPVDPGYLTNVQSKSKDWAEDTGGHVLPFGLDDPAFVKAMGKVIRQSMDPPKEVWCAAGSGTLARALQWAWPDTKVCAVAVGKEPDVGSAVLYRYDREFEKPARTVPPFPSVQEYDAKAWELMQANGSDGAVFWNVACDDPPVRWVVGDSRDQLYYAPDADFVFTCPPYFDLEQYSKDPADLSNMTWDDFRKAYADVIAEASARLKEDRFACVVIGDVRRPDGTYYDLPGYTTRCFRAAGLQLYNEAILVTAVGSLAVRAERQFVMSGKLGKTHQNVLVYVKGDPVKAMDAVSGMTKKERQDLLGKQAEDRVKAASSKWGDDG